MKRNILCFIFLFVFTSTFAQQLESADELFAKQSLNYVKYSLSLIEQSQDRVVADKVFNEILNNIDITKTKNIDIVNAYTDLLSLCKVLRMNDNQRAFYNEQYQRRKKQLWTNAAINSTASISMALVGMKGANPYFAAASMLASGIQSFANYKNAKYELDEAQTEHLFQLEQNDFDYISSSKIHFFRTESVLSNSDGVITTDDISILAKRVLLPNPIERINGLEEINCDNSFSLFAPYFFELGHAYQEAMFTNELNDDDKTRYENKIIECYNKVLSLEQNSIFKKDINIVNASKGIITNIIAMKGKVSIDSIREYLDLIDNNISKEDFGDNYLFKATLFSAIQDEKSTMNYLHKVLDNPTTYQDIIEIARGMEIALSPRYKVIIEQLNNFKEISLMSVDYDDAIAFRIPEYLIDEYEYSAQICSQILPERCLEKYSDAIFYNLRDINMKLYELNSKEQSFTCKLKLTNKQTNEVSILSYVILSQDYECLDSNGDSIIDEIINYYQIHQLGQKYNDNGMEIVCKMSVIPSDCPTILSCNTISGELKGSIIDPDTDFLTSFIGIYKDGDSNSSNVIGWNKNNELITSDHFLNIAL